MTDRKTEKLEVETKGPKIKDREGRDKETGGAKRGRHTRKSTAER